MPVDPADRVMATEPIPVTREAHALLARVRRAVGREAPEAEVYRLAVDAQSAGVPWSVIGVALGWSENEVRTRWCVED